MRCVVVPAKSDIQQLKDLGLDVRRTLKEAAEMFVYPYWDEINQLGIALLDTAKGTTLDRDQIIEVTKLDMRRKLRPRVITPPPESISTSEAPRELREALLSDDRSDPIIYRVIRRNLNGAHRSSRKQQ